VAPGELWLARYAAQLALCRAGCHPAANAVTAGCSWPRSIRISYVVSPLEDSKQIRIEQIRELAEQLTLTSHGGGATVALIAPADALNDNAANALLKTLEEPRPASH
jgi:DNA polymerase III gamma/tau subunit